MDAILDIVAAALLLLGALFALLAGVGIVRMPDMLMRMQAAAKAGTLGVTLIVIGYAAHTRAPDDALRAALIILFLFLTTPVGSHLIARAALRRGLALDSRAVVNQLPAPATPPERPQPTRGTG